MQDGLERVKAYVQKAISQGYPKEHIRAALINAGWGIDVVDSAFADLGKGAEASRLPDLHSAKVRSGIAFKMWAVPAAIAAALFVIFNAYAFFWIGEFSLITLSVGFAGAAALCIGFSFALSAVSYFFDFLDHEIAYRKNLGLAGYFLALTYSFLLLFVNPQKYFWGFFDNLASFDFASGLLAMAILTLMAIVSNNLVMRKIGAHAWRFILRLGYLAYFFLILRAFYMEHEIWQVWILKIDGLPPPRLLISIFALMVIGLRILMEISIKTRVQNKN